MGVGPCEWSEVKTFSRIPRQLAKGLAGLAVLVASAVPLVALAGPASAATAPTLTCSVASNARQPDLRQRVRHRWPGLHRELLSGRYRLRERPGRGRKRHVDDHRDRRDVLERRRRARPTSLRRSTRRPPRLTGFYPVTLTDDNGTATFPVGLGIDNGPQITTIAGNAGTSVRSTPPSRSPVRALTVRRPCSIASTGMLRRSTRCDSNNAGTSLTFNVNNAGWHAWFRHAYGLWHPRWRERD